MIDVTVLLLEGGLPTTSLAPLEIFACAGTLYGMLTGNAPEQRFRVRTATPGGRKTENFVPVGLQPSVALEDVHGTDLVVVPTAGMQIVEACKANAAIVEWLKHQPSTKTAVAGVCSGVSLLASAGLLEGRSATTHWAVVDQCRELFPNVLWDASRFVTEADNVFCGGGLYASIDLSLFLVERYCGHEVAVQTAKALLLSSPRIWQATYASEPPRSAHDDEPVQRAQKWMYQHFREEVDLDKLAAQVAMSPRNFARRFRTATGEAPLNYLHRLRIDAARHLLENQHKSVQEISLSVGYEDVAFFRRLFQRHTAVSPREYRARFGPRPGSAQTSVSAA
jgi:transcriptional regulator GlxA family with amidase domain